MPGPNFSISFTAVTAQSAATLSKGDVVIQTADGYVRASGANRGARRANGITLAPAEANTAFPLQADGPVDASIFGDLGPGTETYVTVNDGGRLQRTTDPNDANIVGSVNALGAVHLSFAKPVPTGTGGNYTAAARQLKRTAPGGMSVTPSEFIVPTGAVADGAVDDQPAVAAALATVPPYPQTAVVYLPASLGGGGGIIGIKRPIVVDGTNRELALLGEHEDGVLIKAISINPFDGGFDPFHGPAICVAPVGLGLGPLPTGPALLTGTGNAGRIGPTSNPAAITDKLLVLSDSPALACIDPYGGVSGLNGLTGFSVELTIKVLQSPGVGNYAVIMASAGSPPWNSSIFTSAFSLWVKDEGDANLMFEVYLNVSGTTKIATIHGTGGHGIPLNTITHIALCWDGTTLYAFCGPPGSTTFSASVAAAGTMVQAIEEDVVLTGYSNTWLEIGHPDLEVMAYVDSVRISNFARHTANYTAPTAKFPDPGPGNFTGAAYAANWTDASHRTLQLLNFDQDVDCFTVGRTWNAGGYDSMVYLLHHDRTHFGGQTLVRLERLSISSPMGKAVHAYSAFKLKLERITTSQTSFDGIFLEVDAYFSRTRNCIIQAKRIGFALLLSGDCVVDDMEFQGAIYPAYFAGIVGTVARNWFCAPYASCRVPLVVQGGGISGQYFDGTAIVIGDENAKPEADHSRRIWKAGVVFQAVTSATLRSSEIETTHILGSLPPTVLCDYGGGATGMHVFLERTDLRAADGAASVIKVRAGSPLPGPAHPIRFSGLSNYQEGTIPLIHASDANASVIVDERELAVKTITYPSDADYTVAPDDWLYGNLQVNQPGGGPLGAGRNLVVPTRAGARRSVFNNTTQTVTVKTAAGTGVAIAAGATKLVLCDGTNIRVAA